MLLWSPEGALVVPETAFRLGEQEAKGSSTFTLTGWKTQSPGSSPVTLMLIWTQVRGVHRVGPPRVTAGARTVAGRLCP